MKRKLNKVSVAALAGAASLVAAHSGHAAITVTATLVGTEVVNGGQTFDVIDFNLTGLTGADAGPGTGSITNTVDPGLDLLAGTFTGSVANSLGVPGNATASNNLNWTKFLNSSSLGGNVAGSTPQPAAVSGGIYDWSYVNLDGSPVSPARSNAGTGTSTTSAASKATAFTGLSTTFNANWTTTDTPIELSTGPNPNPLIAQILVLHGDGVSFSGKYTPDSSATLETTTFSYGSASTGTGTGVAGTGVTGSNKIISLVTGSAPTGTAPSGYGNAALGTLAVKTGTPQFLNIPGGATSGFVAVTGMNGTVAPEFFALQVALNGVVLAPTDSRLPTIIADIKGNDSNISTGVTTVVGSAFANLFPGYDILVPTSLGASSPFFAFDFSSSAGTNGTGDVTDSDSALGPVTVTGIAAVPEPASAAGVILGASGLLLGRRKNKDRVAVA